MSSSEAFGMMGGAFFVSRTELLDWIKSVLKVPNAHQLIVTLLAFIEQGRKLRIRCRILPNYGFYLQKLSYVESKLGSQARLRIYQQL